MNRLFVILCCIAIAGGLFWFVPLFHIEPLTKSNSATATQKTDTRKFAAAIWDEKIIPTLGQAPESKELTNALREKPQVARQQYGRKSGVGRTTLFVVRGKGTIVAIDKSGVGVALTQSSPTPDFLLHTGLVFGNTVRDASGSVDLTDFQDSRQFSEVSTELNRIVETQVISRLKENASIGKRIRFVGCVEVPDQGELASPVLLIPMQVEFE